MACYAYQAVYLAAALLKKQKVFKAKKLHRYGVLIAARNEEAVIAQLIRLSLIHISEPTRRS